MSNQAVSPVIRARNQALTHIGGEQGRAAAYAAIQRVAGLAVFLVRKDSAMSKSAKKPASPDSSHRDVCERLEKLTGGTITVMFAPDDYLENDPESMGHLFSGFLSADVDNDVLDIDDRGDVADQLVQQLEAIGAFYSDLAQLTSQRIDLENGGRVRKASKRELMAKEVVA